MWSCNHKLASNNNWHKLVLWYAKFNILSQKQRLKHPVGPNKIIISRTLDIVGFPKLFVFIAEFNFILTFFIARFPVFSMVNGHTTYLNLFKRKMNLSDIWLTNVSDTILLKILNVKQNIFTTLKQRIYFYNHKLHYY